MKTPSLRMCARRIIPAVVLSAGIMAAIAQTSPAPSAASTTAAPIDPTIAAIKNEGMNHSHVMETMDYLCDVIGPRLTGSPALKRANEWTRDQMTSYGMTNAHLEPWGPFGRGWTLKRFSLEVVGQQVFPVRAYPKAWSPGVEESPAERDVVFLDVQTPADLDKYRGTLKDKIVIVGSPRTITLAFKPLAVRFGDDELAKAETFAAGTPLAVTGVTVDTRGGRGGRGGGGGRGAGAATTPATATGPVSATAPATAVAATTSQPADAPARPPVLAGPGVGQQALALAASEGAALVLDCSASSIGGMMGDSGIIFVSQATVPAPAGGRGVAVGGNPWSLNAPKIPPQATLGTEDYDRIVRMIRQGVKVRMAVNFQAEYNTDDPNSYNTIAEIPGSDLKDQIVMAGAHMDSWHSGTGATDNGAGVGVVLEAVRILTALHLQPRRTIRVALWSGEEQGLLGSAAYVREHFTGGSAVAAETPAGGRGQGRGRGGRGGAAADTASATTAATTTAPARGPEWEKLSCYFNLDNGGGKIRGIYGMGNTAAGPIFKKWFAPFADLGADTVTLGMNGQTDHVSFDTAGLPGFGFIQDNLDYLTRTHHSSADVYDRLQPDDMKEAATVMAAFLWNAANMDDRFPRKPAAPAGGRGGGFGGGRGGRGGGAGGGGAAEPAAGAQSMPAASMPAGQ